MQGLSPSKNTEGYFVLQVGSTLTKRCHHPLFCERTFRNSLYRRGLTYLYKSFLSLDHPGAFHILLVGLSPTLTHLWNMQWWLSEQKWSNFGRLEIFQDPIFPRHSLSKLGHPRGIGCLLVAPTGKILIIPDVDDPHYPAWISGKQAFTLNKEDESFQQWEVQSSQLRKSLLRSAKGEPSRSRRSCWWRRGGLAGPAPRGTWLSLVQV